MSLARMMGSLAAEPRVRRPQSPIAPRPIMRPTTRAPAHASIITHRISILLLIGPKECWVGQLDAIFPDLALDKPLEILEWAGQLRAACTSGNHGKSFAARVCC